MISMSHSARIQEDCAFLGISISSSYYSKNRIRQYMAFAMIHYKCFAFLLGDAIFKYTLAAFKGISVAKANDKALKIGDDKERMLKSLCHSSSYDFKVIRWNELESMPQYHVVLEIVKNEYLNNNRFKKSVRRQVFLNLGERVAEVGVSPSSRIDNTVSTLFDSYILEEIAGLITIGEHTPYNIEIYPGRDLKILSDIYADKYPAISQALPFVKKRKFACVTMV